MRKKRIKTIVCVAAIATMLLSSMGIGVFAEVEQNAPTVQAQADGDEADVDVSETPQADPQEPAAPAVDVNAKEDAGTPSVTPSKKTIMVNDTKNLTASGFAGEVEWSSSDESIATVVNGAVKGEGAGTATITVADKADPTINATCDVTVTDVPLPTDYPKVTAVSGISEFRTVSGHQRIKLVWTPAKATKSDLAKDEDGDPIFDSGTGEYKTEGTSVDATKYIVKRAPVGGSWVDYATINVSNGTPSIVGSSPAVQGSGARSAYGPWTKLAANVGVANGQIYFEDRDVGDGLMDNATRQFRGGDWCYKIVPAAEAVTGSESSTLVDNCVRTSAVALKIKVKKKLKSHDKQHKGLSLKKGATVYTCAFGYGRYQFIHDGNFYWLNRVGTKSHKTVYDKAHPYSDEEVLYYINGRDGSDGLGLTSSSTGKLIWVNTYTQRIYVFQGSAGNYSLIAGNGAAWKVSTGKPATPTIRYIDPKDSVLDTGRIVGKSKTINKKVKSRHGIPCWNCFSTWNAIHGQKKSWSIKGVPKSNGCVRNTNAHAKYIYNNCPKKTRVLIF